VRRFIVLNLIFLLIIIKIGCPQMTPAPVETKKAEYEKTDKVKEVSTPLPTSVPLNFNYDEPTATNTPASSGITDISNSNPSGILKRLLDMVTSLVVVCLLAYAVLKLLYSKGGTIISPITKKNMSVIEQINLQSQKTLMLSLVKVGEKVLLLGITEKEINLLKEFDKEEFKSKIENNENTGEYVDNSQSFVPTGPMAFILNIPGLLGLGKYFGSHQVSRKKNTGGKNNEEF